MVLFLPIDRRRSSRRAQVESTPTLGPNMGQGHRSRRALASPRCQWPPRASRRGRFRFRATRERSGHQRTAHQRQDPRARGAPGRPRGRAGRNRQARGRAEACPGGGSRPRRGRARLAPARRQTDGLREVQVRGRGQGPRGAPQPVEHRRQGDPVPAQDRPARLRDEEGPRGPLPQGGRQGQGDDHVPRPRAVATRCRAQASPEARRGRRRPLGGRARARAGGAKHVARPRTAAQEGGGPGRGASRTRGEDRRGERGARGAEGSEGGARVGEAAETAQDDAPEPEAVPAKKPAAKPAAAKPAATKTASAKPAAAKPAATKKPAAKSTGTKTSAKTTTAKADPKKTSGA